MQQEKRQKNSGPEVTACLCKGQITHSEYGKEYGDCILKIWKCLNCGEEYDYEPLACDECHNPLLEVSEGKVQ